LDIRLAESLITREPIPVKSLKDAKVWATERLDAIGAQAGVIYLSAPGNTGAGTGTLVSNFERSVGWLVPITAPPATAE
jgi:hypothetical protein